MALQSSKDVKHMAETSSPNSKDITALTLTSAWLLEANPLALIQSQLLILASNTSLSYAQTRRPSQVSGVASSTCMTGSGGAGASTLRYLAKVLISAVGAVAPSLCFLPKDHPET